MLLEFTTVAHFLKLQENLKKKHLFLINPSTEFENCKENIN